jgi:hypothetical protein
LSSFVVKEEELAVWRLVRKERLRLDAELSPGGYNIGVNAGTNRRTHTFT